MSKVGLNRHKTLKDAISPHTSYCPPTETTIQKIRNFRMDWISRTPSHAEFLASNLTGCYPVRFSPEDEATLYTDVFAVDKIRLKEDVHGTEGIDPKMIIASNPTYHLIVYLMHSFINSSLPQQRKDKALEELYFVMSYKMFGSLYSHYFSLKPVDIGLAEATFNQLSEKYLIKICGSWQGVLEYRCNQDIKNPLFSNRIKNYNKTKEIVDIIAGVQSRLRSMVKNIYGVMIEVRDSGGKLSGTTNIGFNPDGEEVFKDLTERQDKYIVYLKSIFNNPNDILIDDLAELITRIVGNIKFEKLKAVIVHISTIADTIDLDIVQITVVGSMTYLREKGYNGKYKEYLLTVIKALKGFWSTTSQRNEDLKSLKALVMETVSSVTGDNVKHVVKSMTAGYLIYIFIRSFYDKKQ